MANTNNTQPPDHKTKQKGRFGLTAAEYADLKSMLRQAVAIFVAVGMALTIVALATDFFSA